MHTTDSTASKFRSPTQVFLTVFSIAAIDALLHGVEPAALDRALNEQIAEYLSTVSPEAAAINSEISPQG